MGWTGTEQWDTEQCACALNLHNNTMKQKHLHSTDEETTV